MKMNHRRPILTFSLALMLFVVSCDRFDGDVTVPAFLKIDAMTVVDNPSDSWSQEKGFFSSNIDCVNVVLWKRGDTAETNLGTFQLPCKLPVLREGLIDYIRITPVVRQNGIAGTRISYPFYQTITLDSVRLTPDSVTDFGTIQTRYISKSSMRVVWKEFFEPGPGNISLDSVVSRCYSTDTIHPQYGDYGCGVVRVAANQSSVSFGTDTTYNVSDPLAILYLEMDYLSDFDFNVGLKNPVYSGGPINTISHMTVYANADKGWQKIYINIGSTWSQEFNHYPDIRPYFTIFNSEGRSGNLYIDNVKLITM